MSSILLSHHSPEEQHRCIQVAGLSLCRRCTVLWPATVVVLLLQVTSHRFSARMEPLLVVLALPATLDFVLERLNIIRYHPVRVVIGSLLLALPLGRGFMRYLLQPMDPWFWGLVGLCGIPALLASIWRSWSDLQQR